MTQQQLLTARPIILRAWEVRGVLDGAVTQLWRAMEAGQYARSYHPYDGDLDSDNWPLACAIVSGCLTRVECPWGGKGDKVWGRETFFVYASRDVAYRADYGPESFEGGAKGWRSSATMPRRFSRIMLEVERVSAVQVSMQSVTPEDCIAAAVPCRNAPAHTDSGIGWRIAFRDQWDQDNPRHLYASNPMAWRLVVRRIEA